MNRPPGQSKLYFVNVIKCNVNLCLSAITISQTGWYNYLQYSNHVQYHPATVQNNHPLCNYVYYMYIDSLVFFSIDFTYFSFSYAALRCLNAKLIYWNSQTSKGVPDSISSKHLSLWWQHGFRVDARLMGAVNKLVFVSVCVDVLHQENSSGVR